VYFIILILSLEFRLTLLWDIVLCVESAATSSLQSHTSQRNLLLIHVLTF